MPSIARALEGLKVRSAVIDGEAIVIGEARRTRVPLLQGLDIQGARDFADLKRVEESGF